jgi:hypothetical protein
MLMSLDFFDAGGSKISGPSHATLMQSNPRFRHIPHATLNLVLPKARAILLQPLRNLAQLTVQHRQTKTRLFLKLHSCCRKCANDIRGFYIS